MKGKNLQGICKNNPINVWISPNNLTAQRDKGYYLNSVCFLRTFYFSVSGPSLPDLLGFIEATFLNYNLFSKRNRTGSGHNKNVSIYWMLIACQMFYGPNLLEAHVNTARQALWSPFFK